MDARKPAETSWFRTRDGRRFGVEFAAIIALKLIALALIWFVCFRGPRPDLNRAAIENHLLSSAAESAHDR